MAVITNDNYFNENILANITRRPWHRYWTQKKKTKQSWKWNKREESQKRADKAVTKVMKIWRHIHLC